MAGIYEYTWPARAFEGRTSSGPSSSPRGEGLLAARLFLGIAPAAVAVVGKHNIILDFGIVPLGLLRRLARENVRLEGARRIVASTGEAVGLELWRISRGSGLVEQHMPRSPKGRRPKLGRYWSCRARMCANAGATDHRHALAPAGWLGASPSHQIAPVVPILVRSRGPVPAMFGATPPLDFRPERP